MNINSIRLLFAGVISLHLAVAWPADNVKIAVVVGLSGSNAIYGEGQLHAFNAAADIVNVRGGVLGGRKIEIVPMDHKNTPQEALIQLKRALDDDIGFVASTVSSVVHALSDAVSKHVARNPDKPVLLLNFNSLDPALTESKCSFWQFRFEPHTDMQLAALMKFMATQKNIQKVYLLNQDYAYGQGVSKGSREQLNARRPDVAIVGDELIPLAKVKDFAPYISKIRATGADSVLTGNWGTDLSLLLKASNEMGFKAHYYALLAAGFGTPSAIGAAGADRIKTIYSWHLNATDPKWERTILDYQKRYNTQTDIAYLPAFRTVEMLASAINKAGTTDPVKVAHALEDLHFNGPTGDSWMRAEDHQIIAPLYVMSFVKAGQAGAKHDIEGTGYGWKTEAVIAPADNVPAIKCQMERPAK